MIPILFLSAILWARSKWIDPTPINKMYTLYWESRFGIPGKSLIASIKILPDSLNLHYFINWIDFGLLILVILSIPIVMQTLPTEYWLYQAATLLVLLLRIGPVDNPLQGMGRYMLLIFPFFMTASHNLHKSAGGLIIVFSFILSTWAASVFILLIGIIS